MSDGVGYDYRKIEQTRRATFDSNPAGYLAKRRQSDLDVRDVL
jgi:hypothetical protein